VEPVRPAPQPIGYARPSRAQARARSRSLPGAGGGRRLVEEVERRLLAKGCAKVNLLIEPDNAGIQAYDAALGYRVDPLVFMEKWLA